MKIVVKLVRIVLLFAFFRTILHIFAVWLLADGLVDHATKVCVLTTVLV